MTGIDTLYICRNFDHHFWNTKKSRKVALFKSIYLYKSFQLNFTKRELSYKSNEKSISVLTWRRWIKLFEVNFFSQGKRFREQFRLWISSNWSIDELFLPVFFLNLWKSPAKWNVIEESSSWLMLIDGIVYEFSLIKIWLRGCFATIFLAPKDRKLCSHLKNLFRRKCLRCSFEWTLGYLGDESDSWWH